MLHNSILVNQNSGVSAITVTDTLDANGGTIREITAVDISGDTVDAAHLFSGYTAHDAAGNAVIGTYTAPILYTVSISLFGSPSGWSGITEDAWLEYNESSGYPSITVDSGGTVRFCIFRDNYNIERIDLSGITLYQSGSTDLFTYDSDMGFYYYNISNVQSDYDVDIYYFSGTAGTPSATKGVVSNHAVTVTPSVTNTAGYIAGGTVNGSGVSVSASELVSGNLAITENGTGINVANYETVSVDVESSGGLSNCIVTLTLTNGEWMPDKTYAEILAAYNAGDTIITSAPVYDDDPCPTWCEFYRESAEFYYYVTWFDFDDTGLFYHDLYRYTASGVTLENRQSSGSPATLVEKTITANGTYNPISTDSADGYSLVTVNVPTGVARTSSDLAINGATVTTPAGLYAESASASVISGSAVTPATTITANPSISVNSSGLITATASASQNVTPTVSEGYVSNGTAGTITVSGSNTQQLTTLGATTYTPSETAQTITAGKYITGTQTISAIPSTYVGSGITRQTGLTTNGATVTAPAGYYASAVSATVSGQSFYSGSSAPSSSLGSNGDIYLQTS